MSSTQPSAAVPVPIPSLPMSIRHPAPLPSPAAMTPLSDSSGVSPASSGPSPASTMATDQQQQAGSTQPAKKQPRKRSRSGCLTCRSDKKKCDERKPICSRCQRLNYSCSWPEHIHHRIKLAPRKRRKGSTPAAGTGAASASSTGTPTGPARGREGVSTPSLVQSDATESSDYPASAPSTSASTSVISTSLVHQHQHPSHQLPHHPANAASGGGHQDEEMAYILGVTLKDAEEKKRRAGQEADSHHAHPQQQQQQDQLHQPQEPVFSLDSMNLATPEVLAHQATHLPMVVPPPPHPHHQHHEHQQQQHPPTLAPTPLAHQALSQHPMAGHDPVVVSGGGGAGALAYASPALTTSSAAAAPPLPTNLSPPTYSPFNSFPGWDGTSGFSTDELLRLLDNNDPASSTNAGFFSDHFLYNFDLSAFEDHQQTLTAKQSHLSPSSPSSRIVIPKDKLDALAAGLPRKVYALIEKIMAEQDRDGETSIPVPYLINLGLWLPARALQDLAKQSANVYASHPLLKSVMESVSDATMTVLTREIGRTVKESIAPEEICNIKEISVETKIHALIDMAFRAFYISGAPGWYKHIAVIERFLCRSLKPGRVVNLGALRSIDMFGICNFMWADICRSVALGQPTLFPYVFEVQKDGQILTGTQYSSGSSDIINCLIADISSLKFVLERDLTSRPTRHTLSENYEYRAKQIKQSIVSFIPNILEEENEDYDGDSLSSIASITVQECWRQAALIHFYQSLYLQQPDYPPLQQCLRAVLRLCKVLELTGPVKLDSMTSLPVFLASTLAINPEDRQECLSRLDGLGSLGGQAAAHRQNKQFIEMIYAECDRLGRYVDWHDYASTEVGPAFM